MNTGIRKVLLIVLLLLLGASLVTAAESSIRFDVSFGHCEGGYYWYVLRYLQGDQSQEFNWRSGQDGGTLRLWPDRAPMQALISTETNWMRVRANGQTDWADTREICNPNEEEGSPGVNRHRPAAAAYQVSVLNAGQSFWVCMGFLVVDDQKAAIITPTEFLYWKPLDTTIRFSTLVLSAYIHPADCTAYDDTGQAAIEVVYVDYPRFTCLAYKHEDLDCPGEMDRH